MKLLLYDKFWDSFMRLPKGIQQKVIDLQHKLRQDSRSAALHLEPIHTFLDPQLRTARVDLKYRAIVAAPTTGDVYYLLWVDNHDEAMDWARNKQFHWNEQTQAAQLFEAATGDAVLSPTSKSVTNSPEQTLYGRLTDEQLLAIGVPGILIPAVRNIADLNALDQMEPYLPGDAFENLFYAAEGADIDRLIEEVAEGKVDATQTEAAGSLNNQRHFIELTDDALFNQALTGEFSKWKFYLHPSQRKLVEGHFNGSVKVSGGAGTGKTVAAIHRLKHLIEQYNPDRKLLFTTFTRSLTDNLEQLIRELGVPTNRYEVRNIDALMLDLARQYGLLSDADKLTNWPNSRSSLELWESFLESQLTEFEPSFLNAEYEQVVLAGNVTSPAAYYAVSRAGRSRPLTRKQRMEVWRLIEQYNAYLRENNFFHRDALFNSVSAQLSQLPTRPYSYVIADELQDLANVELRFLRALTEEGPNDLFLVGDPLQRIYARKVNFTQAGINIRGVRSRRLRINYRTTEEIKRFAVSVIQQSDFDDFDGGTEEKGGYRSLFHGQAPSYQVFESKEQELAYVLKKIDEHHERGIAYADMVVASRTKEELKTVKTQLHNRKLPYSDLGNPGKANDPTGIRLCSFHNLKGLEFKSVFLIDINQRTLPFKPASYAAWDGATQTDYLQSERSLLYVASTRAVQSVTITGTGRGSDWLPNPHQ
ncbi:AAA family ATPase [Rudanella paleaurantiibacter]|uniref:DNA 3'-5' helicase n=1 Tax=Rudanella paleaurantiibacter TaxID=2614655 RepID=A0A7J5TSY0_9BACT|nr:DEAD/DEAH box helicase [Rudanella paleaurantiibacter]KAB7726633.1 AAA family ATPase [Rudanella paleaurantiibacter]